MTFFSSKFTFNEFKFNKFEQGVSLSAKIDSA